MRVPKFSSKNCSFRSFSDHFLSKSRQKGKKTLIFEKSDFQANSRWLKDLAKSPKNHVSEIAPRKSPSTGVFRPESAFSAIDVTSSPLICRVKTPMSLTRCHHLQTTHIACVHISVQWPDSDSPLGTAAIRRPQRLALTPSRSPHLRCFQSASPSASRSCAGVYAFSQDAR